MGLLHLSMLAALASAGAWPEEPPSPEVRSVGSARDRRLFGVGVSSGLQLRFAFMGGRFAPIAEVAPLTEWGIVGGVELPSLDLQFHFGPGHSFMAVLPVTQAVARAAMQQLSVGADLLYVRQLLLAPYVAFRLGAGVGFTHNGGTSIQWPYTAVRVPLELGLEMFAAEGLAGFLFALRLGPTIANRPTWGLGAGVACSLVMGVNFSFLRR